MSLAGSLPVLSTTQEKVGSGTRRPQQEVWIRGEAKPQRASTITLSISYNTHTSSPIISNRAVPALRPQIPRTSIPDRHSPNNLHAPPQLIPQRRRPANPTIIPTHPQNLRSQAPNLVKRKIVNEIRIGSGDAYGAGAAGLPDRKGRRVWLFGVAV